MLLVLVFMKLLLLSCLLFPTLTSSDRATVRAKRIVLRSIQVLQSGRPLPDSAYRLTTQTYRSSGTPLTTGTTLVAEGTYWIVRRGRGQYTLDDVAKYVRYAGTYDLRLELNATEVPLQYLNLNYYDKNGDQVTTVTKSITSGHEERKTYRPTCDNLFLVPVKHSNKR